MIGTIKNKTALIRKVKDMVQEPKHEHGFFWSYERFDLKRNDWAKSELMTYRQIKKIRSQDMLDTASKILGIPPRRAEGGRWQKYLPHTDACAALLERRMQSEP